jgi:hypothetical protein
MAEGGIPAEALISLRRRLEAMPTRSADRKGLIAGAAALYGVSRATLYRALKQHPRPRSLRRSDRGLLAATRKRVNSAILVGAGSARAREPAWRRV